MSSLLRNSFAKAFGNWSRRENFRPKKPRWGGGGSTNPPLPVLRVKDKDDPKDRQGTVYRIRCNDCNGTYIGETGRTLTTRPGEHQTATDKEDLTNNIAQHHRKTGHDINWDSATCLTHSTDKDQGLTLESWFTNLQPNPLNRSRKLPGAYERLLRSEYRTALPTKTPTDFDKYA